MVDGEVLTNEGQEEDLSKYQGDAGTCLRWLKEISLVKESKPQKAFERHGEKICKDYRNAGAMEANLGSKTTGRVMFNVLWSNVEVLSPSLFSRLPKIIVERRFKDSDPVGRLASQLCERATSFTLSTQQDRTYHAIRSAVKDRLLPGRGQVWLRYDCQFIDAAENDPNLTGEDGGSEAHPAEEQKKPNSETVVIDPVNYLDFFHSPARNPFEIRWVARRVYMTRAKLVARFKEKGQQCELMTEGKKSKLTHEEEEFLSQAEVFEIWDSESKNVYFVSEGYKESCLDVVHDPLRLSGFFPCPMPLLATTTSDSMYPTPDFKIYEKLAEELDYVTKRISSMVECVRFVGATAASLNKEIKNVLKLDDGQVWPMDNWAQFAEGGGFKGAVDWVPFEKCVEALQPLIAYQQSLLSQIFEITGIPDIVRGSSDPTETLGAQQQKGHWTVVKISEKQAEVQRFCREVISKVAEVIFEPGLFSDDTIAVMCGVEQMPQEDQQNFPLALQLLRSDRLRTFRVDIETDSTIAVDEDQDKAARMEYIAAVNQLISNVQNISQFRPELMSPVIESALFAVRSFRTGRPVEGSWERAMQQIEDNDKAAAEAAAQNPPPPDYEMMKAQNEQAKIQQAAQEMPLKQAELQIKQQDSQFKQFIESQRLQLEGQKAERDFSISQQELQIKAAELQGKAQVDAATAQLESFKQEFSQFVESQRLELDKFKAKTEIQEKLMEEERLKRDTQLEQVRLMVDMSKNGAEGKSEAKPPVIHIHNGGGQKEVTMKRLPTGELVGRSRHVDDEKPGA